MKVAAGPNVGLPPTAFDGVTDLYVITNKNFTRTDPMRMASYIEAQLMRTEALGGATAVGIVNARRAQLQLPAYSGGIEAASIRALILYERNREFFMEGGHRYNDLHRFSTPWKRVMTRTVFRTGRDDVHAAAAERTARRRRLIRRAAGS